jgi:hypothetical protein
LNGCKWGPNTFGTVDPTALSGRDFFCPMVVAGVLVGQALFIPSPCEGLPVQVCGAQTALDIEEWLSYSKVPHQLVAEQVDCVFRHVLKATVCVWVAPLERSLLYS